MEDKDFGTVIFAEKFVITQTASVPCLIKDSVEGDMTISIKLQEDENDKDSYTLYNVIAPDKADVVIVNTSKDKSTEVSQPILVGTYEHKKLYLYFRVSPLLAGNLHEIDVKFFVKGGTK